MLFRSTALAPQGYLLASADLLYVPCGRTAPLAYARADGSLRGSMEKAYAIVASKGVVSGDYGVLVDANFFLGTQNELHCYQPDGKHTATWKETSQLVATPERYFRLSGQPPPKYGRATRVTLPQNSDRPVLWTDIVPPLRSQVSDVR